MSERKKGDLDYTPRAFPGARAPDGPAPNLEDKLAQLGLLDRVEAKAPRSEDRADVKPGVNAGAKKRNDLDYTPQAFPGARVPDGPAPGLEDRLVQMGLAERSESSDGRHDARHGTNYSPPQPPRSKRPAQSPSVAPSSPPPSARRERPAAPSQRATPPAYSPPPAAPRERITASSPTSPASPALTERTRSTERAAPPTIPAAQQAVTATPQPVYVVPPPGSEAGGSNIKDSSLTVTPAPLLPPVPPEAAPRPIAPAAAAASIRELRTDTKSTAKTMARTARSIERVKELPDRETRVRLSARLVASVDEKLTDLAHLRGLDRNTAVSVAIVQDWVQCFGLHARQTGH